jgi:dethiobiotin synthetase
MAARYVAGREAWEEQVTARGLYVAGTDTGVGKTAVAVAVVRHLVQAGVRIGVYKPVASGVIPGKFAASDPGRLWEAAGRPLSPAAVCPQAFLAAIAPPHSARVEGRRVDERLLRAGIAPWIEASDFVVVEGAGGLYSPLGDESLNADLARDLALPLVVVDAARLGAVGRTLATVRAARADGLRVAAVVLSQADPAGPGDPGDPAAAGNVARYALGELAARLAPLPVGLLDHGADRVVPVIDWTTL